jgi:hypothetical protein
MHLSFALFKVTRLRQELLRRQRATADARRRISDHEVVTDLQIYRPTAFDGPLLQSLN